MEVKKATSSKTFNVNLILMALLPIINQFGYEFSQAQVTAILGAIPLINIILRFLTKGAIILTDGKQNNGFVKIGILLFILFAFIFSGFVYAAEVTLAWNKNTEEVTGYKIYYDVDNDEVPYEGTGIDQGNSPIDILVSNLEDVENPQITLTGLVPNTYRFVATAYDNNNNESGYSNLVHFKVVGSPLPPNNLTGEYDGVNKQVILNWEQNNSNPVDYWKVFYRISGNTEWVELDQVQYSSSPILTNSLTTVANGEDKTVEFIVVAFQDNDQFSGDSNIIEVRIDRKAPEVPVLQLGVNIPVE